MSDLPLEVIRQVVRKLILPGQNYRMEIVGLMNIQFMDIAMDFLQEVAEAKSRNETISMDWYKTAMLSASLPKEDIAYNAGINMKTISNVYGSGTKEIVLKAAAKNYGYIKDLIDNLVESSGGVGPMLTIKLRDKTVALDISESLIVINALAVKRAALRGGLWSSIGKRVEKRLMLSLCYLFRVSPENYGVEQLRSDTADGVFREVDFVLKQDGKRYKCEVKLMGKGNPESADSAMARDSDVFLADTLSARNIEQLSNRNVEWVSLRGSEGWLRFATVLRNLGIPHREYNGDLESEIDAVVARAMNA